MKLLQRAQLELLVWMLLAIATTLLFWFTDLDIKAAAHFYHPENSADVWPERHWWLWQILFDYAFPFTVAAGIAAFSVFLISYFFAPSLRFRRQALYIVLVIAIGPGLVVNLIFKDHWGRPRPMHITQFGGEYQYIPPIQIGDTPDKSFVCGHCSVGYAFFALYFLAQNYRIAYFLLTLGLAWTMGFTRMTSGGHFVSDILWSGYLVFLVAFILYYGWYARVPKVNKNQ
ncbi:phosphatase PAP2 family protein [Methylomonas sp. AM2-LC]|uniref:phosphatase PAP2 family protein n=1 Tax=Methylomonas sp. AM2-LC TaxID=3153301 RepID=UPI0032651390